MLFCYRERAQRKFGFAALVHNSALIKPRAFAPIRETFHLGARCKCKDAFGILCAALDRFALVAEQLSKRSKF
jgi:hypothetical protein